MWLVVAAISGLLAVAAGAFGGHVLSVALSEELAGVYRTGVEYHFYHSLALLAVASLAARVRSALVSAAGWCFALGTALFSGSLYALAVTGIRGLGVITPWGGVTLLVGWTCLIWVGIRHARQLRP